MRTSLTAEEQQTVQHAEIAASAETDSLIAIIRRLDGQIEEMHYEMLNQSALDSLDSD